MMPTTIGKAIGISAGQQHRLDRRAGDDVDRAAVLGPLGALHDPGMLAELAPHLLDDLAADPADRLHRERREQERHQAADEEAGDHPRVGEAKNVSCESPVGSSSQARRVRVEQDERRERGRADRVALRDGLRRVADRVERVGDRRGRDSGRSAISAMPPALSVTGPNASSATIRPVIESCAITATPMPKRPAKWLATGCPATSTITGSGGGLHADGEALDDVRRVAGLRGLGDLLHRVPAGAGVELGDRDEQERDDQADDRREVEILEVVAAAVERLRDRDEADRREDGRRRAPPCRAR